VRRKDQNEGFVVFAFEDLRIPCFAKSDEYIKKIIDIIEKHKKKSAPTTKLLCGLKPTIMKKLINYILY